MMTALAVEDMARDWALALVKDIATQRGRMDAYAELASSIGGSASRLRKFIGRQPNIAIKPHEFLNLAMAYRTLCERIEAKAEQERARAAQAREKANAAFASALGVVDSASRAHRSGAAN